MAGRPDSDEMDSQGRRWYANGSAVAVEGRSIEGTGNRLERPVVVRFVEHRQGFMRARWIRR